MTANQARHVPRLRHFKARDLGFVELNGQRTYLGKWGAPETRAAYHRALAEWEAAGRQILVSPEEITVNELVSAYWKHARCVSAAGPGSQDGVWSHGLKGHAGQDPSTTPNAASTTGQHKLILDFKNFLIFLFQFNPPIRSALFCG